MIRGVEPPKGPLETNPWWVFIMLVALGASVCAVPLAWAGILYLLGANQ